MKILVVNPVGHPKWDEQDKRIYESFASPETMIDVVSLPHGPPSVETPESYSEVVPLVIRKIVENQDAYDGFIVNCCLDPGVGLLKGIIRKPVIGPCEASLAIASTITDRIGIVTVGGALWMIRNLVRSLGYIDRLAALETIELGVLDLDRDVEEVVERLVEKSRLAVSKGSEAVVLGCTGLAGLAGRVGEEVGVPVIDPSGAALKMLEGSIKLRLRNPVKA